MVTYMATLLSQEVLRILRAPYPCSLQNIKGILKQIDRSSLIEWARSNACRLHALVPVVLEALESESCALDVLEALTWSVIFRKDVLASEPLLLETLLQKTLESKSGFQKYSATCVNLLSSPLSVAIPASTSYFLTKLLDDSLEMPCADTIKPIYSVLSGVGALLLDALPPGLVARLQEQFKKMLQIVDLEDHVSNLYCLAVLAIMSSSPRSATSTTEHDSSAPLGGELSSTVTQPENYFVARQYFTSKRAAKTLDLVVLKFIFACSKSCALSPVEVLESLRLSNVIIEAVSMKDRQQWMMQDRGRFRKLVEKVVLYEQQSDIIFAALHFIDTLVGDGPLPQELTSAYQAALRMSSLNLPRIVGEKILLSLDESSIQDQLLWILHEATHDELSSICTAKMHTALALVETFSSSVEHSAPLRQKLLYLLSTNVLGKPLDLFLSLNPQVQPTKASYDDDVNTCRCCYDAHLIALRRKICILFLNTALLSQSDSLSLDASLGSALLHKVISFDRKSSCERYEEDSIYPKRTRVALFEASSTPNVGTGEEQWRERIKHDLAQTAEHQYQTIVRTMGEACKDLERRCTEIERPLREEQAKSKKLQDQLGESRLRIAELESHNHGQSLYLEGLDHEKSELADSVRHLKNEREDLVGQVEGLRQGIQEATQRMEEIVGNSTKRIKELELVHAATIAEKEEEMDAERHSMQELETKMQNVESDAARMRERIFLNSEEVARLETTVCEQKTALDQANAIICEKRAQYDEQMELFNGLRAERSNLQDQLQELSSTCQVLREELEAKGVTIQDQSRDLSKARSEYKAELSEQANNAAQLQRASEKKVEGLQSLLDQQTEEAVQVAEENKAQVRQLEMRLVELQKEIDNRENELEEAQGLTNQVMAFWNKQRRRNTTIEGSLAAPEDIQGNKTTTNHLPASPSPARETPPEAKRTKTRQRSSSRRHTADKARLLMGSGTPRSRKGSTLGRQPLQDLDIATQERSNITLVGKTLHTKTQKMPFHKDMNNENAGPELAGGSFCDSDFFASSDQNLIADIHAKEPQGVCDDTTMEF